MSETQLQDGRYKEGKDVVLVVDGERFVLPPLEPADFDAIEEYYAAHEKTPADALKDVVAQAGNLPANILDGLMDRAWNEMKRKDNLKDVSRAAMESWLDTFNGAAYSLFTQFKKKYPDITLAKVKYILRKVGLSEGLKAREQASKHLVELADALKEKLGDTKKET